jgi:membrane-associated protein
VSLRPSRLDADGLLTRPDQDDGSAAVGAVLQAVGGWPAALVLAVAAVVLVLESGTLVGVVLPGATTLVALGLWSAASGTPAVQPIAVAAVASTAGALLAWYRGHRRRGLTGTHGGLRIRVDPAVARAQAWLSTQGPAGATVLIGAAHWVAGTRTVVPRVAGGAGVPLRLAAPAILLSGTAWVSTVVLLARALGQRVADEVSWAPAVVLGLVLIALAVRSWRHARRVSHVG